MSRSSNPFTGDDRGFTLVEVLIAMVIMLVGLVAVAQLMAVSVHNHTLGRRNSEASVLATAKLEELSKLNFNTNPAVQIGGNLGANAANFNDTSGVYTRRWLVEAGPTPNTRRVTVRVISPANRAPWTRDIDVVTILRQW